MLNAGDSYICGRMLLPSPLSRPEATDRLEAVLKAYPHLTMDLGPGGFATPAASPPVVSWKASHPPARLPPVPLEHRGRPCLFRCWAHEKTRCLDFYVRHSHADAFLGSEMVRAFLSSSNGSGEDRRPPTPRSAWSVWDTIRGMASTFVVLAVLAWRCLTSKPPDRGPERTFALPPIDRASAKRVAQETDGTVNSVVCAILEGAHSRCRGGGSPIVAVPVLVDPSGSSANGVGVGLCRGGSPSSCAGAFRWFKRSPVPALIRKLWDMVPFGASAACARTLGRHVDYVYSCVPAVPVMGDNGVAVLSEAHVSPYPVPTAAVAFPLGQEIRVSVCTADPSIDEAALKAAWERARDDILSPQTPAKNPSCPESEGS